MIQFGQKWLSRNLVNIRRLICMDKLGHVWTVPAVQEESDVSAKRSGAAMYTAYCRLEDYLGRDAATWPLALM